MKKVARLHQFAPFVRRKPQLMSDMEIFRQTIDECIRFPFWQDRPVG